MPVEAEGFGGTVIVHYRSEDTLVRTVGDCLRGTGGRAPVVIVDNSASAPSFGDPRVMVLPLPSNPGYAAAVNRGLNYLREISPKMTSALVATHEVRMDVAVFEAMFDRFKLSNSVGIVAPKLMLDSGGQVGSEVWSCGGYVTRWRKYAKHHKEEVSGDNISWVDGACYLLSISAWRSIGGVPECFFLYGEDVALGYLLRESGFSVEVCNNVSVVQSPTGGSKSLNERNRLLFLDLFVGRSSYWLAVGELCLRIAILPLLRGRGGMSASRASFVVLKDNWTARRDRYRKLPAVRL